VHAEIVEVAGTGEQLVFRTCDAEAVVFESILPAQQPGLELPPGAAPEQRFEVIAGTVGFQVGATETLLTAGGRLTVPRGTACRYWNAGTVPSHLVGELRPAPGFERHARNARLEGYLPALSPPSITSPEPITNLDSSEAR
jgi:hypothetical protein